MAALHWKFLVSRSTETRLQTDLWPACLSPHLKGPPLPTIQPLSFQQLSHLCSCLGLEGFSLTPFASGLFSFFMFIFTCYPPRKVTLTLLMKKVLSLLFSILLPNLFRKLIIAYSDRIHLVFTCLPSPPECWVHKGEIIIANTLFTPSTGLSLQAHPAKYLSDIKTAILLLF